MAGEKIGVLGENFGKTPEDLARERAQRLGKMLLGVMSQQQRGLEKIGAAADRAKQAEKGAAERLAETTRAAAEAEQALRAALEAKTAADLAKVAAEAAHAGAAERAQRTHEQALRARQSVDDAQNREMAQRMQQEEVVEILQGRDTRAYLESQMAEIRALRAEVAKMRKEQAAKEAAAQREKENPYASGRLSNERQREAERGRRELADAEGELLSMRQKWALVQQSLKGEQAKFVDRNAGKLAVSDEIPDAIKEEMKAAGVYQGGVHEAEAAGGEEVEAAQGDETVTGEVVVGEAIEAGGEGEMPTAAEMGLDQPDEFEIKFNLPENADDRTKRKLNTALAARKEMESAQGEVGEEGNVLTGEVLEDEDRVEALANKMRKTRFFNRGASEWDPAHVERGERVAKKVRGRAAVVRWMKRVAATAAARAVSASIEMRRPGAMAPPM